MHLTRLSRIESVPSPSSSLSQTRPPPSSPSTRGSRLLPHILTFTFLSISTILILLTLLLPNHHTHLSSFIIRPVDKIYIPSSLISASDSTTMTSEKPLPTGMWGQDESPIEPSVRETNTLGRDGMDGRDERDLGVVTWYGIMGPEVWVGPMQICSRSDKNSETVCTSSSTPTFHARVLPFNLADPLLALPTRPISPILLLITSISILLATLVHAFSLSNVGSCRPLSISRSRSRSKIDSESEVSLDGNHPGAARRRSGRPHIAFAVLVGIGLVLSIAAAGVERRSVNDALGAWDERAAASVGLEARMGVLAHLIPLIPFFLSLALLSSYLPLLPLHLLNPNTSTNPNTQIDRNPPMEAGAEIRGRAEISGLFAHVTDSGKKLSDGRAVFAEISPGTPRLSVLGMGLGAGLPEIVIVNADRNGGWVDEGDDGKWMDEKDVGDMKMNDEVDGDGGGDVPRSAASCRTFGVGEAV